MAATATEDIQNNNIEVHSMADNLNYVNNVSNSKSPPHQTGVLTTGQITTGHTLGGSGLPRILQHLDNEEPTSIGSLNYDDEYHDDPFLDLTPGNLEEEYADPSMDYIFVSSLNKSSCLDNSEALLQQLQDMGVRVNEDYLNLDFDLSMSRSCSVSSYSGPESLEEEADSLTIVSLDASQKSSVRHKKSFSKKKHSLYSMNGADDSDSLVHTDSFEDEVAEAEILPDGVVKITYENYKKEYRSRVTPIKNYVKYLELTPEDEEVPEHSDIFIKPKLSSSDKDTKKPLDERYRRAAAAFSKRMSRKIEGMSDELSELHSKYSLKLKKLLAEEISYDAVTPDSGVHETFNALSPEEQEKQREEWKSELVKTEEEIQTLRQVLNSKVKHAQDLKRRLGVTVWREFTDDFNASMASVRASQTLQSVQNNAMYQKTAGAMGAVGEKTAGLFGGISAKFGAIKENPTFKSFEERVGGVVASAKVNAVTWQRTIFMLGARFNGQNRMINRFNGLNRMILSGPL